jgi:hypothetical protein
MKREVVRVERGPSNLKGVLHETHGVAIGVGLDCLAGMAISQTMNNKLVTPAEIQWGTGPAILPAGAQAAVLYGDPTKDGLFSIRFKLPKSYRVPPHTLSKAGFFTVISGTFTIGMGAKADPSKARAMPAGSFIALAPAPRTSCPWTRRRWFSSTISARG